jgi:hypothetical protein
MLKTLILDNDVSISLQYLQRNVQSRRSRENALISAGKYSKIIYGYPAETYDDLQELEHRKSLQKQREVIEAYDKDVLGSYQKAKEKAEAGSITSDSDRFIERVRTVAIAEFQDELDEEVTALKKKYDFDQDRVVKQDLDVLDVPLSMAEGMARDVGVILGKTDDVYASLISGVVGTGSLLDRGLSAISDTVDKGRLIGRSLYDDVGNIVTESPWIKKGLEFLDEKEEQISAIKDEHPFMYGIQMVHTRWLREIAADLGDILNEWYHDPRTLCCFIKNIAALAKISGGDAESYFKGDVKWTDLTGTREFFDKIIAILKVIRAFLTRDIGFGDMLTIDLGLAMSKASMAALMAALMAIHQGLRDTLYAKMLDWLDDRMADEWQQCFPFEQLLRLIAEFITGPEGLLRFIQQYVDSFLGSLSKNMHFGYDRNMKNRMKDVAAIDKLISLLEALRDALLNLEMCIEADFSQTDEISDDKNRSELRVDIEDSYTDLIQDLRTGTSGRERSGPAGVVFPTDNEVKNFITNRLGESEDFADQVIKTAKRMSDSSGRSTGAADSAGSDTSVTGRGGIREIERAIGDCARTLNPDKLLKLSNVMANWEIKL